MMVLSPNGHSNVPDWTTAAADNPILAAAELFFISHPSDRVPWRHLLRSPSPSTWGRKRSRSSKPTSELDCPVLATRSSPTTPLSWSAASTSSSAAAAAAVKVEVARSKAVVGVGRRRKMTVVELKESELSLLEQQMELRKELEERRSTRERLMEENARLRKLESMFQDGVTGSSSSMVNTSLAATLERHQFPSFDLNKALTEELDVLPS